MSANLDRDCVGGTRTGVTVSARSRKAHSDPGWYPFAALLTQGNEHVGAVVVCPVASGGSRGLPFLQSREQQ